ncbi:hypothetical protein BVY00_01070 [bacterium G20]|nr:hypothetical protein BVY00_01070 [bacterium G20]
MSIPYSEKAPDIVKVAFNEIDRMPPAQKAEILGRIHDGVVSRVVEMIPVKHALETDDIPIRDLARKVGKGGNFVAWTEVHRPNN